MPIHRSSTDVVAVARRHNLQASCRLMFRSSDSRAGPSPDLDLAVIRQRAASLSKGAGTAPPARRGLAEARPKDHRDNSSSRRRSVPIDAAIQPRLHLWIGLFRVWPATWARSTIVGPIPRRSLMIAAISSPLASAGGVRTTSPAPLQRVLLRARCTFTPSASQHGGKRGIAIEPAPGDMAAAVVGRPAAGAEPVEHRRRTRAAPTSTMPSVVPRAEGGLVHRPPYQDRPARRRRRPPRARCQIVRRQRAQGIEAALDVARDQRRSACRARPGRPGMRADLARGARLGSASPDGPMAMWWTLR